MDPKELEQDLLSRIDFPLNKADNGKSNYRRVLIPQGSTYVSTHDDKLYPVVKSVAASMQKGRYKP